MKNKIYLDHAATTELSPTTKQYIIQLLDQFYNPSSLYQDGVNTKQIIEQSRKTVANFINTNPDDIIFTSSGSASNTLGIKGFVQKNDCCILYSPIAHKSILKCVESCNVSKYPLKVDNKGFINTDYLEELLDGIYYKPFIVLDYANSEIGTIQDVKKIVEITHKFDGIVMLDCTGSISTVPLDVKGLGADLVTFSGHKLNALKGCGVLYKKSNIELEPLVYGSQENGVFGGTENLLAIASLGKAIEQHDYSSVTSTSRDYVYNYIINNIPDSCIVGADIGENRLPHNLYMCFKGVEGESLMILLDMNGIQVSTGSACNNYQNVPSATLTAIGMSKEDINSCIRLSFSGNEHYNELNYVCDKLKECVERLRLLNR